MMRRIARAPAVLAFIALVFVANAPGVAARTRQLAYDNPDNDQSVQTCTAGQDCTGSDLQSFTPFPLFEENYNPAFTTAYFYSNGIVSLNAPLPDNDVNDFGSVTYFAPAYSPNANYQIVVTTTNPDGNDWGFLATFSNAQSVPIFQLALVPLIDDNTGNSFLEADYFYYGTTDPNGNGPYIDPPQGAYIGYNVNGSSDSVINQNLDFTNSSFRIIMPDDASSATDGFNRVYLPTSVKVATPEPASWAMMLGGFAVVGGMLRRRPMRNAARA